MKVRFPSESLGEGHKACHQRALPLSPQTSPKCKKDFSFDWALHYPHLTWSPGLVNCMHPLRASFSWQTGVTQNKRLRDFSKKERNKQDPNAPRTASPASYPDIIGFHDIVSFRRNELDPL